MNQGKAALMKFMQHLASVEGTPMFEIGDMYQADATGWRVYISVGDKALAISPKEARNFAKFFEREAGKPEWHEMRDWALDNASTLRAAAQAVHRKNRDHVVPDGYATAMPTAGTA